MPHYHPEPIANISLSVNWFCDLKVGMYVTVTLCWILWLQPPPNLSVLTIQYFTDFLVLPFPEYHVIVVKQHVAWLFAWLMHLSLFTSWFHISCLVLSISLFACATVCWILYWREQDFCLFSVKTAYLHSC